MQLNSFWTSFIYVLKLSTLSPLTGHGIGEQATLLASPTTPKSEPGEGPVFRPPGGDVDVDFFCNYSTMSSKREPCSTPEIGVVGFETSILSKSTTLAQTTRTPIPLRMELIDPIT